jgi:hypothetical protein
MLIEIILVLQCAFITDVEFLFNKTIFYLDLQTKLRECKIVAMKTFLLGLNRVAQGQGLFSFCDLARLTGCNVRA